MLPCAVLQLKILYKNAAIFENIQYCVCSFGANSIKNVAKLSVSHVFYEYYMRTPAENSRYSAFMLCDLIANPRKVSPNLGK